MNPQETHAKQTEYIRVKETGEVCVVNGISHAFSEVFVVTDHGEESYDYNEIQFCTPLGFKDGQAEVVDDPTEYDGEMICIGDMVGLKNNLPGIVLDYVSDTEAFPAIWVSGMRYKLSTSDKITDHTPTIYRNCSQCEAEDERVEREMAEKFVNKPDYSGHTTAQKIKMQNSMDKDTAENLLESVKESREEWKTAADFEEDVTVEEMQDMLNPDYYINRDGKFLEFTENEVKEIYDQIPNTIKHMWDNGEEVAQDEPTKVSDCCGSTCWYKNPIAVCKSCREPCEAVEECNCHTFEVCDKCDSDTKLVPIEDTQLPEIEPIEIREKQ